MLKLIIALVVAIPMGWHIFATAIYVGPGNLLATKYNPVVQKYMAPVFSQNWHLFSPNPGITNDALQIRCKTGDDEWKNWIDPLKTLRNAHYRNRTTGRGKLLYVYRSLGKKVSSNYTLFKNVCTRKVQNYLKNKDGTKKEITPEIIEKNNCTFEDILTVVRKQKAYKLAKRFSLDVCESVATDPDADVHAQFRVATMYPKQYTKRDEEGRWGKVFNLQFSPEIRKRASTLSDMELAQNLSELESGINKKEINHDS